MSETMKWTIELYAFAAVIVIILILFLFCLIRYFIARRQNRKSPGSVPDGQIRKQKRWLVGLPVAALVLYVGFLLLHLMRWVQLPPLGYTFLFFGPPVLAVLVLVINLLKYGKIRKQSVEAPDTVSEETLKKARNSLIISSVVAFVLVTVVVGFISLLFAAIAFM